MSIYWRKGEVTVCTLTLRCSWGSLPITIQSGQPVGVLFGRNSFTYLGSGIIFTRIQNFQFQVFLKCSSLAPSALTKAQFHLGGRGAKAWPFVRLCECRYLKTRVSSSQLELLRPKRTEHVLIFWVQLRCSQSVPGGTETFASLCVSRG